MHSNYFTRLCEFIWFELIYFFYSPPITIFLYLLNMILRLPFEWKSPLGYALASVFQWIFFFSVLEIFVTFLAIYLGICQYSVAFVEDIEQSFRDFHQDILRYRGVYPPDERDQLYGKLCEIIEFHSRAMQLSFIHSFHWKLVSNSKWFFLCHSFVSSFSKFYKKFMSTFFVTPTSFLCIFGLRIQMVRLVFYMKFEWSQINRWFL